MGTLWGRKTELKWETEQLPEEGLEDASVLGWGGQDSAMGGRGRRRSSWGLLFSFLSEGGGQGHRRAHPEAKWIRRWTEGCVALQRSDCPCQSAVGTVSTELGEEQKKLSLFPMAAYIDFLGLPFSICLLGMLLLLSP